MPATRLLANGLKADHVGHVGPRRTLPVVVLVAAVAVSSRTGSTRGSRGPTCGQPGNGHVLHGHR